MRTVPPKGVDLSSTDRMDHPAHTYVTTYNYNSLKQLVLQYTPDGDTTEFWYDSKGQLRFSRNKKQKLVSKYSYTKYDNLGRIIEVGQSSLNGSSTFYTNANTTAYPTTNNEERTFTVYTTPITKKSFLFFLLIFFSSSLKTCTHACSHSSFR